MFQHPYVVVAPAETVHVEAWAGNGRPVAVIPGLFGAAFAFPHIPAIGNLVSFRPNAALIVPVLAAAFVLCVLGSFIPAWRAVRMLPAEALRRI